MDTIVLKFGGSSVSDNIKLNIVADKIKEFYKENNVVVVVSAQGKTTDNLLREAHELSNVPNERELDTLLSAGEQISMSKLSILLNRLGYPAISLTGWQAGIFTSETNQSAVVESIDTTRIEKELAERKIVIIAGFQGINEKGDITTFGRGGSDTTAVAVAAALKAPVESICTSSIIYTLYFATVGKKFTSSLIALTSSTLLFDAASISTMSVNEPSNAALHISHSLQGSPSLGFKQFTALAKILAADVFPVPLPPLNKYACPILPLIISFFNVLTICSCPTISSKVSGLNFLYKAVYSNFFTPLFIF